MNPPGADLVHLVERDEDRAGFGIAKAGPLDERREQPTIVDPDHQGLERHGGQRIDGRTDELDLGEM